MRKFILLLFIIILSSFVVAQTVNPIQSDAAAQQFAIIPPPTYIPGTQISVGPQVHTSAPNCIDPTGGGVSSTYLISSPGYYELCPGAYKIDEIRIEASDVVLDCNGATLVPISNPAFNGILVLHEDRITIKNCKIDGYSNGITLIGYPGGGGEDWVVNHNEILHSHRAISASAPIDANIFRNNIHSNTVMGIILGNIGVSYPGGTQTTFYPNSNKVYENYIHDHMIMQTVQTPEYSYTYCDGSAIRDSGSQDTIHDNFIENMCMNGITLYGSPWFNHPTELNTVKDNIIKVTFHESIYSFFGNTNTIDHNTIDRNHFRSIHLFNSTNEMVIENNIEINNALIDPYDEEGSNSWNINSRNFGNYYDDLQNPCVDVNNDDICDDPYKIPGNSNSIDNLRSEFPIP